MSTQSARTPRTPRDPISPDGGNRRDATLSEEAVASVTPTPKKRATGPTYKNVEFPSPEPSGSASRKSKIRTSVAVPKNGPPEPEPEKTFMEKYGGHVKVAIIVVVVVVLLAILSKFFVRSTAKYSKKSLQQMDTLVRHAKSWSEKAAQDTHPLVAYMDVTQALTNAHVARQLVDPADAAKITGVSIGDLVDSLERQQSTILNHITTLAPTLSMATA